MAKLAINGGKRVIPEDMPMFHTWPMVDEEDKQAILAVFDRGIGIWGTNAPETVALQKEWAKYVGVAHCLLTNSGTSAIHIGVRGVGVSAGDEVLVSAYSYGAAPATVFHQNAIPVFVDIDPKTFTIDPTKIEERITGRTKAIMPVHIFGLTADMDPINEIAAKHDLKVVTDAAQAAGSEYKGRKAGAIEDAAGFSLNPTKNLPGIEGGLFTTSNPEVFEQGTMCSQNIQLLGRERQYPVYSLGFNYRSNEMTAAFARSQLRKLDKLNEMRIKNCNRLTERLKMLEGVQPPYVPESCKHTYHMYRVRFEPKELGIEMSYLEFREKVTAALEAEGVMCAQWIDSQAGPNYPLFQVQEGYGNGWPWKWPENQRMRQFEAERSESVHEVTVRSHNRNIKYNMEEYPETKKFIEASTAIIGAPIAKSLQVVDMIADAFEKIWENMEGVLDI
ncbi:DegT/DnrJ/EryC1/StrS family aminotransferase [bacterium]|nr:DegT/DnrJ/EryC1/StrS family aminotransferase [bacterium]